MKKNLSLLVVSLFAISLMIAGVSAQSVTIDAELVSGAVEGEQLVIKGTITNTGEETVTYTLNVAGYAEWASAVELSLSELTLVVGQSADILFTFDVGEDAAGNQVFDIEISSGGYVVLIQPVLVSIEDAGTINVIIYIEGDIISPEPGYISGNVLISWENGNFEVGWLKYKEGICDETASGKILADQITGEGNYIWDTTAHDDGDYCIKITGIDKIFESITVTIDNTPPEVEIVGSIPGIESDTQDPDKKAVITFYIAEEFELESCEINWGDGKTSNCNLVDKIQTRKHQYKDGRDEPYEVTVTVKDKAGHKVTSNIEYVSVANVDPEIIAQIDAPNNGDVDGDGLVEASVGEAVKFTARGDDVVADLSDGLTCTWTFDGANPEPTTADKSGYCEVFHTWEYASVHTVDLTITDKDGGSVDADQFELEVEEPIKLDDQEVIAFHKLNATFSDTGKNRFKHGITNGTCVQVTGSNIDISDNKANTKCIVKWQNPRPTNDEQGEHPIIVKVVDTTDSTQYEYYSFTVTVYSWIIHLQEGWNLISIPLVHKTGNIGDILDSGVREKIERVWSYEYNADTGSGWSCVRPTSTTGSQCASEIPKITSIIPGRGYWIKVEDGEEVTIKGFGQKTSAMPAMIPEIDAPFNHWALLGRYGIVGETEGIAGALKKWVALKSLPQTGGRTVYEYVLGSINLTNELNPQQGYWAFVSNSGLAEDGTYTPINPEYSYN